MHTKCLWENLKGRDYMGGPDIDERTTLKHLKETGYQDVRLDSSGSGYGPVVGCCEHGNESSGSMKGIELLD